ncbi:40189_t:CDS:1, partial [Gigaspora margarita]
YKCSIKNIIPISTTNSISVPQIKPDTDNPLDQVSNSLASQTKTDEYLFLEKFEYLKALGLIKNNAILDTSIYFIQTRVSNLERPIIILIY